VHTGIYCNLQVYEVKEVLIQCMDWNIATSQSSIAESEFPELQKKAVDLLDILQKNLPEKTAEKGSWNFEKAHSILHIVHTSTYQYIPVCTLKGMYWYVIVLWGNSYYTSCQSPEVCTSTYKYIPVYTSMY
jgi:hypothetical protein